MKIAQVCPYNIFRSGGVQSHIWDLSKELRRRGHEVKIIAPKVKGHETDEEVILLGQCAELSINKTQIEVSVASGKQKDKIDEVFEREKFDIIHFHEPWVPVLSIQILLASDGPKVGTFHSATTSTIVSRSMEAFLMPIASYVVNSLDQVISVSQVPAEYIRSFYKGAIDIIPNGLDLDIFKPASEPFEQFLDGKVNIFFIGRLDKRKGVIHLVKAFRRLKKSFPNVRLIIGGKGDEEEKIKDYIKKHEIGDIVMLGYVEEEDKLRYFATCDIFCSPALYGESFGIVLAEAMASGKVVVAGDNPGYRCVLEGTGEIFMVEPKKTKNFAKVLKILCLDKDLRDFMGRWGVAKAQDYSWKVVCDEVLKVYEKAIKSHAKDRKKKLRLPKIPKKWLDDLNGKLEWGE